MEMDLLIILYSGGSRVSHTGGAQANQGRGQGGHLGPLWVQGLGGEAPTQNDFHYL